nr:ATP-binding cassette domain-containing protein [Cohnella algarum]
MELLNLAEFENTPVRQLSLGQRMRAEVACAFFHEPAICYLDEPTIGLDVVAKEELRRFLREINRYKQVSIVLTTHDMDDIEQICERLVLIDHGQLIYDGTTLDFKQTYGTERVLTVEFEEEVPSLHIAGARVVANERKRATLVFQKNEVTATQLIQELASSYPVLDCELTEPKIENLVRHVYSQKEHLHE